MPSALLDHLHLPQQCVPAKPKAIPKSVFTRQANLTARQQRLLTNVERVALIGTLTHATTGMPTHIDDTYDVQSILVLGLNLRETKNANEAIEIIHRALPHPTVLLVEQDRKALVSLAIPRKSLAEHDAMVVGYHVQTSWVDAYAPDTQALWEKLPYEAQPHGDLLAYAQGLGQNLALWNLREWVGNHARIAPSGMTNIREPLIRLETLNAEISQLRALRRNPDTPLRESSRLRVQEHRLAQDAIALAERIQGALR